jgi:hypothetical protein
MDDLKTEQLTEEEQKDILKNAISIIVENYKMLLSSNNKINKDEKQKFYNDLDHNITLIEFITKCKLDSGVLWNGIERKHNKDK